MQPKRMLLVERLAYLAVIAWALWNVTFEGYRFAKHVRSVTHLPGLVYEGPVLGINDLSDYQWRSFRASAALLAGAMAGFVCISRLARALPAGRQPLMVAVSLLFLVVLHGSSAIFVLLLLLGGYGLSRRMAKVPYGLLAVWAYACATLLLVRIKNGFSFHAVSPSLSFLDHHSGLLRWHIHYNLLILRLISFAADLHWSRSPRMQQHQQHQQQQQQQQQAPRAAASPVAAAGNAAGGGGAAAAGAGAGVARGGGDGGLLGLSRAMEKELRTRVETPLPLSYYGLGSFLEYVLYPPLYIAGPIITFNSFASQRLLAPIKQLGATQVIAYILRAALAWACLEGLTHALPYNSIAKHRVLERLTASAFTPAPRPLHYAITGYWVLIFMWLKFTVIWRFFRAAALADGVVPPENMTRCVCNNYDIE
ncbi:hypothetical protein Agub_g3297, partial [Astrephomene gubernaculifera]